MRNHQCNYSVEIMSKVFGVSKSGYYKWLKGSHLKKDQSNIELRIRSAFESSRGTYGSPRIHCKLADMGCSRSTVGRRMRSMGLVARRRRKFVATTDSKHGFKASPNLLERKFEVEYTNKVWVSDITYINTDKGWRYLTVVLDLGDRSVVGWALSDNMSAGDTVVRAFKQAVQNRGIQGGSGLMFHSDRGVQYACDEFRELLDGFEVTQSMSRKGNCWDNAVSESFFKTIKTEELDRHQLIESEKLNTLIFRYIEGWYNTQRIHSTLNGKTPWEVFYEKSNSLAA